MRTEFLNRFYKDIDKITHLTIKRDLAAVIEEVERVGQLSEIKNIKKLKGHSIAYRIRLRDYRIGIYYENNIVQFARIVHRKDIYNVFP